MWRDLIVIASVLVQITLGTRDNASDQMPRNGKGLWDNLPGAKAKLQKKKELKFSEQRQNFFINPEDDYASNPLTKFLLHKELHSSTAKPAEGSIWNQIGDSHSEQQRLLNLAERTEPPAISQGGKRQRLLKKIAEMVARKRASEATVTTTRAPTTVDDTLSHKLGVVERVGGDVEAYNRFREARRRDRQQQECLR